ncbi:MAG: hypothetical protein ACO3F7_05785, partial [Luteolibacter sp.]
MFPFISFTRILSVAAAFAAAPLMAAPAQLVFQNGRSIPLDAVEIAQDKIIVKTAADGLTAGQTFPLTSISHVFGDRPAELNKAIA